MSLLGLDIGRKKQVKKIPKLDAGNDNSKKYKVEVIWDNTIHAKNLESAHLLGLYYLIAWKSYPKIENIWEPLSAVQHLQKLISCFYKKH